MPVKVGTVGIFGKADEKMSVHLFASCDGSRKRTRARTRENIISCAAIVDINANMFMVAFMGWLVLITPGMVPRTLVGTVLCALASLVGILGIIWKFSVWVQIILYYHACSECGSVITQNKTGICDECQNGGYSHE